jgi:hypothetical protein
MLGISYPTIKHWILCAKLETTFAHSAANEGTLESTISPPTSLLGPGPGRRQLSRMIAFQGAIEF